MKLYQLLTLFILISLSSFWSESCLAQTDTVVVKQGDKLIGEIEVLDNDILRFKTGYADAPISVKWGQVIFFRSKTNFKLQNSDGNFFIGRIQLDSINRQGVLKVWSADSVFFIKKEYVQAISKFEKKLSDRLKINADLGIITTKANNSDQVSLDLAVKYFAKRWEFDFDYSGYASTVDSIHTQRANLGLSITYNFPKKVFLIARVNSFLSTEQQIDSRVTYFIGSGKYFFKSSRSALWAYAGGTYNREKFTINTEVFKTAEAFGAVHFEISPLEKLNVTSDLVAYPSLSEAGRVRIYSKTDIIMNFGNHFRFGLGYVLNTDNKPPVASSKTDYLFNVKLGWAL